MNMNLSARLNRAGIEAGLCTTPQPGGATLVHFKLMEMADADRADQSDRVPGAAADRLLAEGEGGFARWVVEMDRTDAVVAAHFDITERFVFVQQSTGQVILHVHCRDRKDSARWIHGIGWVGW